jgi:hypothetical protein
LAFYFETPFESLGVYGFYSPLGRMWEFGLGAIVATMNLPTFNTRYLGIFGWLLLLSSLVAPFSPETLGPQQFLAVSGSALLIYSGLGRSKREGILKSKPLVFIGDISYSWYLWHWPIIVFVAMVSDQNSLSMALAAGVSIVPAILSYRFVETPIRNSGWKELRVKRSFPKLILITSSSLAISGLLVGQGFFNPEIRLSQQQVVADHAPSKRNWLCALGNLTLENVHECTWNFGNTGKPIYLVGDSQAGMFSEAAIDSAEQLGSSLVISTVAACPLLVDQAPSENCARFSSSVISLLEGLEPGIVVMSFLLSSSTDPNLSARELTDTVLGLQSLGHRILFLETVPHFSEESNLFNPLSCTLYEVAVKGCISEIPRSDAIEQGKPLRNLLYQVAKNSQAQTLPTLDLMCGESLCSTTKNGSYMYKDATHISVFASHEFSKNLADAIKKLED